MVILFYKPYGVVSQFTPLGGHPTLAQFGLPKGVYACGRLDHDSEGLLVLTDRGGLVGHARTYLAQVERVPDAAALAELAAGPRLSDGPTKSCRVRLVPEPELPPRVPPIRYRKNVPTAWLELVLTEGRNRQVRRMTAAVGHPTLRLVRVSVGSYTLEGLVPGSFKEAARSRDLRKP